MSPPRADEASRRTRHAAVTRRPAADLLRGLQSSDGDGRVRFDTVYPGWYPGRATHVHLRVLRPRGAGLEPWTTTQLGLPDAISDAVHRLPGYAGHGGGAAAPRLHDDFVFRGSGGERLLARVAGDPRTGLRAAFDVALPGAD